MSFLMAILVGQIIAIVFVMFVLKIVLDKMLIDLAVQHVEVWKMSEAKEIDRILILTAKSLKQAYVERIKKATAKSFASNVVVDFQIQKSILGGAIIRVGEQIIDCSLKDRLQKAMKTR